MSSKKGEDLLLKLVDMYTSTTAEQEVAKAQRASKEKQAAAKARGEQFASAQQGLYLLTGATAGVLLFIALRTFSRARQLA